MKFSLSDGDGRTLKVDLLAVPVFDGDVGDRRKGPAKDALGAIDAALKGRLLQAARAEGFRGKVEQTFSFHTHGRVGPERVLLVGVGSRARFTSETLRLAAGRAVKAAQKTRARQVAFALPAAGEAAESVRAVVEGAALGHYRFDRYRTQGKDERNGTEVRTFRIVLGKGVHRAGLDEAIQSGERIAEATNWARDLVNEPGGVMTPARLADEARSLAKLGLNVTVRGREEIQKLGMGMFLGVAQGSQHEPQLIEIGWTPKSAKDAARPAVALVGKAITFDSGGLSLKTPEGMVDMKTDMAGAAAVLGAMRVIAQLSPPFPVRAYMGACENMPSGTAYRPGDVLISRIGKSVEVTNTDAEGRLVLGDVLTYASEAKPAILVDIATLTGACMVALGHYIAGVWGEDDAAQKVLDAAKAAGEDLWRMPLYEMQRDALRSDVADMKNSGERWGAALNAAIFLKEFVRDAPWVHIDIAGPSQSPKERGYHAKGATGIGVRTLVELVHRRAESIGGEPEPAEPAPPPATPKPARAKDLRAGRAQPRGAKRK